MRILIRKTFKHVKENMIFERGKDYPVKNELGEWILRKKLGIQIAEVKTDSKGKPHLKDVKKPVKDKMIKNENVITK